MAVEATFAAITATVQTRPPWISVVVLARRGQARKDEDLRNLVIEIAAGGLE